MGVCEVKNLRNFLFLSLVFLFVACDSKSEVSTTKQIEQIKTVKILDLNSIDPLLNSTQYPAQIYPYKNTVMAFEVSGKIVKFNYKVSDKLKKGDIIAQLDDEIYRSNFVSAKANYKKAKLDFDRYQTLYKTKTISKSDLEKVKQSYEIAKSNYNIAKKNFENTKLIAEFDGVLAQKSVDDFARITAKQPIVVLQDNSKFKVKFYVPENDIINSNEKIDLKKIANKVDIFVSIGKKDKYRATLLDISTKAESITRTYETTVLIKNPKNRTILPGMTAKVKAIDKNKTEENIFVPFNSLFTDNSKNSFVWKIES